MREKFSLLTGWPGIYERGKNQGAVEDMQAKPTRSRLPPEQRRAQLLHCAIEATAEHGIARITHAHVARLADVSVAAVHSYFRTREDLVTETLAEVETRLLAIVTTALAGKPSPRDALAIMAHGFDLAAREDAAVVKVWLDWSTGFRAEVWQSYLELQDKLYEAVRKVLAAGKRQGVLSERLNVKAAARLFIGGGHTIALTRFAGAGQNEIDILTAHLIDSIMAIGCAEVPARVPAVA